jgi:penicillin amidase
VSEFVQFREEKDALSLYWTFLETDSELMEAFFDLNNAENMDQAREAVSLITAPGLNVSYADKQGNIALWAAGRLVQRPAHLRAAFIHDGHSGEDEMLGYHPWSYNPKLENPPWGFVHSANNQHASYDSTYYPGYYEPDYRAQRIGEKLAARRDWSIEAMKRLVMDD